MQKPDSLIFDMDGTLWDAVDTYTESWNILFEKLDVNKIMTRAEMMDRIGMEGKKAMRIVLPNYSEEEYNGFYEDINNIRRELLAQRGGILYDGVLDGLEALATKYPLFILSNCAKGIIRLFIDWAGIDAHITDELAYGINFMPKEHNIKLLIDKHQLKSPVYIGDTAGDSEESRKAGVPFVFAAYGFGSTDDYDLKFDDFRSLTSYFMGL